MTDAQAPSLLDRVKAAMGTYKVGSFDGVNGRTRRVVGHRGDESAVVVAEFDRASDAAAHALDLNARAVLDAIVGALRWRDQSPEPFSHVVCEFAGAHVGAVGNWAAILGCAPEGMPWRSFSLVVMEWHATEPEAKTAVEAAFKAALVGE